MSLTVLNWFDLLQVAESLQHIGVTVWQLETSADCSIIMEIPNILYKFLYPITLLV